MTAKDAPSTIAMMRIGKNFQQFDSDTTAMVLLEGQDKLGDDAHRFYDTLIQKLSRGYDAYRAHQQLLGRSADRGGLTER